MKTDERLYLDELQRGSLPKINIKTVLSALSGEDMNTLIPLYYVFSRRDLHIASELSNRRMQVSSLPYAIDCDDKKTKEFLDEYLKTVDMPGLVILLMSAVTFGFAAIDMVYGDEPLAPREFHLIHARYFEYLPEGKKLLLRKAGGEKLDPSVDPEKFLLHYHKLEGGELIDYGVMGQVIFTALLKHAVINSNMQYYEALGVPPITVKLDAQTDEQLKQMLSQVLKLRSNAVGVFPKEAVVELLEGKAAKADFLSFIKYCDSLVSHFIMGATLAGGKEETGSHALGVVHDERRKDIMRTDARLLEEPINRLLKLVLSLNVSSPKPFKFRFDIGDEKDEKTLSETYKNLSDSGYLIPPEHIAAMFAIDKVTLKNQATEPAPPAQKNSKEKNAANPDFNPPLKAVETDIKEFLDALLKETKNYEEALAALEKVYPELSFDSLIAELEEGIMRATIFGYAEAQGG